MSLTTAQRLSIKKHLKEHPTSTIIDPLLTVLEDGGDVEAELVDIIDQCDNALSNRRTAQDEADEIIEGAGAKFSYERRIAIKQRQYEEAVIYLAQYIGWPSPYGNSGRVGGFFAQ